MGTLKQNTSKASYKKNPMIKMLQAPSALVYSVDSDMHPLKQFKNLDLK